MTQTANLLTQINRVEDYSNMSDLEKKHDPVIMCPDSVKADESFECKVHVGKQMEHPNEPRHFIQSVDVYLDDLFLARVDLQPQKSDPIVTFNLRIPKSGMLKAYDSCNIHGIWTAEKEISVM